MDAVVLARNYPQQMARKVDAQSTVLRSLVFATSPREMGYVLNVGRFVARHPNVTMLHGTRHNEAFHMELKAFFRNVMRQTREHAVIICKMVNLVKLVCSVVSTACCLTQQDRSSRLRAFMQTLQSDGLGLTRVVRQSVFYELGSALQWFADCAHFEAQHL